jgi:hypothetical protein
MAGSAREEERRPIEKARDRFYRRGLHSCDDMDMPVICPTCQNLF